MQTRTYGFGEKNMNKKVNKSQIQELLHYFLFDPNIYISVTMKIKKKSEVSIETIVKAVETAYTKNETTMSKLVLDNGEIYFENMSETGCKVFIDGRDFIDILHENEKKTFRINEGELVRTFIADKKDEVQIFIMAHHILGDGHSLVLLAQDILSCLANEEVDFKPLDNENQESIPADIKYPFLKKAGIKLLNKQWKKTGKLFEWEDYFKIHEAFWKDRQTYVENVILSEDTKQIRENSKKIGITVNSYIVAKQLEKNPEYESVGMPISYRKNNRSLANKVTIIRINYKYNQAISFEENAKKIHKIIKKTIEDPAKKFFIAKSLGLFGFGLLDGALMAKYTGYENEIAKSVVDIIGMSGKNKTQLGITNLGKLNLKTNYETFEVVEFEAMAASMSTTSNVMAICTLNDRMNICLSSVKKNVL